MSLLDCVKDFLDELFVWNKFYNLQSRVGVDWESKLAAYDCLAGAEILDGEEVFFDIGCGAGFPGVIIAMVRPRSKVFLVEVSSKKCAFLRYVKSKLNLRNVFVVNTRVEELSDLPVIVSRAAFSLDGLGVLVWALRRGGVLYLWLSEAQLKSTKSALVSLGMEFVWVKKYTVKFDNSLRLLFKARKGE